MTAWLKKLLAAPVFEGEDDKTRVAGVLNAILLILFAAAAVVPVTTHLLIKPDLYVLVVGTVAAVGFLGLLILLRRGHVRAVSVLLTSLFFLTVTFSLYRGVRDLVITGYFFVIALASLLLGGRGVIAYTLACILAILAIYYAEVSGLVVFDPIEDLPSSFEVLALIVLLGMVALLLRSAVRSIDEGFSRARRSAQILQESNRELEASHDELSVRTRQLERRARYLEATAAVARDAGEVMDVQELLSRVASLISERFGVYHTGIFLVDPGGVWAELKAASSEGGQRMLARKHRLRVGEEGIVGYVTGRGTFRIAFDVGKDAVYFDNPDLSETRSEIALPLRGRGGVIGALDVQSTESGAFSEEDVAVLQTLADQVAVAIQNARLFQRVEESVEAERRAYGELSREAWQSLLSAYPDLGFFSDGRETVPSGDLWRPEMSTALHSGQIAPGGDGARLAIPIKVREQVIGVVDGRKPDGTEWTAEEIELLQALTNQLNVALEGARLYRDAQSRETRERLIGSVATRIRESLDMETMLRTAVDVMRTQLDLPEVVVRLATPDGGSKEQE